jgi:GNAT superfamily N-acetyltransferase
MTALCADAPRVAVCLRGGPAQIPVPALVTEPYSAPMERAQPTAVTIENLADRPDLLVPLAQIRWQEWGSHTGREALPWWVETTRDESGRDGVPVTFVAAVAVDAANAAGEAVGGVGLIHLPQELPELAGRGPWVVGTIVRADYRGYQIGSALVTRLMQWATEAGIDRLWVATGDPAVDFYVQCGFEVREVVRGPDHDQLTVLSTRLDRHHIGTATR